MAYVNNTWNIPTKGSNNDEITEELYIHKLSI